MSPDHLIRTLIVEPDPVVASLHSEYVKKTADFTVGGVAYTGAEALQLLDTEPFGLILLDLQLPDISGLELCRILRARNSPVDIIVITAARQIGLVRSALSFGVVHYLLKPLTLRSFQGTCAATPPTTAAPPTPPGRSTSSTSTRPSPSCAPTCARKSLPPAPPRCARSITWRHTCAPRAPQ